MFTCHSGHRDYQSDEIIQNAFSKFDTIYNLNAFVLREIVDHNDEASKKFRNNDNIDLKKLYPQTERHQKKRNVVTVFEELAKIEENLHSSTEREDCLKEQLLKAEDVLKQDEFKHVQELASSTQYIRQLEDQLFKAQQDQKVYTINAIPI